MIYIYIRIYVSMLQAPVYCSERVNVFTAADLGYPMFRQTHYLAVHAKTVGGQKAYCTPVIDWTQQVTMSILSAKLNSLRVSQSARLTFSMTGWWFGTCFIFPNSWDDDPI